METRELGQSGISVTRIVLGCGNFGGVGSSPAFFGQGIAHDEAFRIMDAAWELGITTFDTADAYGGGRSETWIGEWLAAKDASVRDRIVVETKTFNPMESGADHGLSSSRILRQIDASLERLGLERVPLYLAHAFDDDTPQEESLRAFDELVRSGKVGAVGASNFGAEQLAEAVEISELEGLVRYEWVQNSFSLLEYDDAETVFPVCHEHGLGYEAFGPLAGGWLSGKYRRGEPYPEGSRMTQRPEGYRGFESDTVFDALEAFEQEALARSVSMAGLALGWLLGVPEVTAVVVGPTRAEHLVPVEEALALELTPEEHAHLRGLFSVTCSRPVRARGRALARHGVVRRSHGRGARSARARRALPAASFRREARGCAEPHGSHAGLQGYARALVVVEGDRDQPRQPRPWARYASGWCAAA